MNYLVVTFGISGSGKTTVSKEYEKEGFIRICPDDIRKEKKGNISDQSKNAEVFAEAEYRVLVALKKGKNVIFDSTGLDYVTRKRLQRIAYKTNASPTLLIFNDSLNVEECRTRVKKDLENGEDRANTDSDEIFDKQIRAFTGNKEFLEDEGWDGIIDYEED